MKWEAKIKEKLEKRTIEPSHQAWEALSSKLDAADKKKAKTPYWWMGIAASGVAILLMLTVYFNKDTEMQPPVIVHTQEQDIDQVLPIKKLAVEKREALPQQIVENSESVHKDLLKKERIKQQNDLPISKPNSSVAHIDKKNSEQSHMIHQKELMEATKVTDIVAQVQDLKSQGLTVTDEDIEALLVQAQKEIRYQTVTQDSAFAVDAHALLQNVESDLQQSFRNKIFEALKNSYETVKTAVAERHN